MRGWEDKDLLVYLMAVSLMAPLDSNQPSNTSNIRNP